MNPGVLVPSDIIFPSESILIDREKESSGIEFSICKGTRESPMNRIRIPNFIYDTKITEKGDEWDRKRWLARDYNRISVMVHRSDGVQSEDLPHLYKKLINESGNKSKRVPKVLVTKNLHPDQVWQELEHADSSLLKSLKFSSNFIQDSQNDAEIQHMLYGDDLQDSFEEHDSNEFLHEHEQNDELEFEDQNEMEDLEDLSDQNDGQHQENAEDEDEEIFSLDDVNWANDEETPLNPSKNFLDESDRLLGLLDQEHGDKPVTAYQKNQKKMSNLIKHLEQQNLETKPWQLSGEIDGKHRPKDSLLNEYLQYDHTVLSVPVITPKFNDAVEKLIKYRIKDKIWDDVERKKEQKELKPQEFRLETILSGEKSKKSLAEIYEADYLQKLNSKKFQEEPNAVNSESQKTEGSDSDSSRKSEIKKLMHDVFDILDRLSKNSFTPQQPMADIKITTQYPTMAMEEAVPIAVATIDSNVIAPEEVSSRMSKLQKSVTELSKDEKKVMRAAKKRAKQRKVAKSQLVSASKLEKPKIQGRKNGKRVGKEKSIDATSKLNKRMSSKKFFTDLESNLKKKAEKSSKKSIINSKALKL